ncbi:MAG: type II secretion system F family protein [Bacillota bacterium]
MLSINLIGIWITVVLAVVCFAVFIFLYRQRNPLILEEESTSLSTGQILKDLWLVGPSGIESVNSAMTIAALCGGGMFVIGALFEPLFSIVFGIAGALIGPRLVSNTIKTRKLNRFRQELEPALEGMLGSLLVGSTLARALDDGAEFCREPVRSEFKRLAAEISTGTDEAYAFKGLSERYPSYETTELWEAIEFYKSVGGSRSLDLLRSTLLNLKEGMASRHLIKQHTKGPKLSAVLVTILPIGYIVAMIIMAPDLFRSLIDTSLGRMALLAGAALYVVGIWTVISIMQSIETE